MVDANFRARCKDRKLDDFELASGWSYYIEEAPYLAHVEACADRKEVSAIDRHCASVAPELIAQS